MEGNNSIYLFPKLRLYLENMGIQIGKSEAYRKVTPGDVSIDSNGNLVGDVILDKNGMFAVEDILGIKRNVFLIKKSFYFEWKGKISIPKAHLCMCKAIANNGEDAFRYANEQPVSVIDRATKKTRFVDNLELCGYCAGMLKDEYRHINTIEDFVRILKEAGDNTKNDSIEVDFAGYVKDWKMISEAYRETKHYICEKCGIDLNDFEGKLYCQVHHLNRNKLDNRENNFQCLCVQCHSEVDDLHKKNFETKAQRKLLEDFRKYKEKKNKNNKENIDDEDFDEVFVLK